MEENHIQLLLIEDNPGDARLIREALREARGDRFDLEQADRLATGLARLDEGGLQLVLLDLSLPDSQGMDTVARTHAQAPDVPIVVLTGLDDEALALRALETGAQDYLVKGDVDGRTLRRAIRYAIERQQARTAFRQSEASFRRLFANNPLPMWVYDLQTLRFLEVNDAAVDHYGYSRGEFLGMTIADIRPSDDLPVLLENLKQARPELQHSGPWRHRRKDGTLIDVAIASHLFDFAGRQAALVVAEDITERKQAEEALQKAHDELEFKVQERTAALSQANALLQTMMDYVPDHIYFKDAQSRFIRNSRSQADLMGLSDPAEVVGKTDFDFFPHAQRSYEEEQELMRSGQPLIDLEEYVAWPDGRATWVSTTKAPLRDIEGQIIGTFGISRDITERKQAEEEIRKLNEDLHRRAMELEATNKELEAFSYSVSHDLRAPLRSIDGFSQILLEDHADRLDANGKDYLRRVRAATVRMAELIDGLLTLSHMTRAELRRERADLSALARTIAADLRQREPERSVEFLIADGLPADGDARLLHAALENLLGNAWKYSAKQPQARIEFGALTPLPAGASPDEVSRERGEGPGVRGEGPVYFVRDNGAGFDMAYADKLFGVFQRLHTQDEFKGVGIGLATVARIIHRHGGRIWAEGAVGEGAAFFFTLGG